MTAQSTPDVHSIEFLSSPFPRVGRGPGGEDSHNPSQLSTTSSTFSEALTALQLGTACATINLVLATST